MEYWLWKDRKSMKPIRAFIVLSSFLLFYIGATIINFIAFPFIEIFAKDEKTKYSSIIFYTWKWFIKFLSITKILKLKIEDIDKLRSIKGKIIVSTHPSYIDILILMSLIPNSTCFVKKELAYNPTLKKIINKIFIQSGLELDEMQRITKDYLDKGFNVIIFPAGIRHRKNEYPKIKKGTALISMNANKNIVPIEMYTDYDFLQIGQSVLDAGEKPVIFNIKVLEEINIQDYITEDEVDSRKNITRAISKALYYAKQD